MSAIAIKCASCGVKLGTADNLWLEFDNTHIALITDANTELEVDFADFGLPEQLHVSGINNDLKLDVALSDHVKVGERETAVESSKLRNVSCSSCNATLGLQLVERNFDGHVLANGQYIFFVKSIILKSSQDGRRKVEPNIHHSFRWKMSSDGPHSSSSPSQEEAHHNDPLPPLPPPSPQQQQQQQNGIDHAIEEMPEQFVLDKQVAGALQSVVSAFGQDIKSLHDQLRQSESEIMRLRDENRVLKEELEETKQHASRAVESSEKTAGDLSIFKGDLEKLLSHFETYPVQTLYPAAGPETEADRRHLKRSSAHDDDDDDSPNRPQKRVAVTPEVSSTVHRRFTVSEGSQRSSPIVSSASRKNGLLTRPARRSSGIFGGVRRSNRSEDVDMDA